MKKRFVVAALLLSAFALGGCVDNKESVSVEAVRMAKVKQLESVAAMNMADADATKLLAEADAAMKNAQAEALKITNEGSRALLAVTLAGIEQKVAAAELDAKAKLAKAQQDLADALVGADAAKVTRINQLASNYTRTIGELNAARTNLLNLQKSLISLEADLVSVEKTVAQDIAKEKKAIASQEALIAVYKEYSGADKGQLKIALDASALKYENLSQKVFEADQAFQKAQQDVATAENIYSKSKFYALANTYGNLIALDNNGESVRIDFSYSDGYAGYITYMKYGHAKVDAKGFELLISYKQDNVAAAKKEMDAQQKAWEAAMKETSEAEKAWMEAKEADKPQKRSEYEQKKNVSDNLLNNNLTPAQKNYKAAQEALKQVQNDVALLTDTGVAEHKKVIDARNSARKAIAETQIAYWIADDNADIEDTKRQALESMWGSALDVKAEIEAAERTINASNVKIAQLEKYGKDDKAALVTAKKAEIEAKTSEIKAKEIAVKNAKAALDAAIAAE